MITREPHPGDQIEYNPGAPRGYGEWKPAGTVVAVHGNICYTRNDSLPADAHQRYFGRSPVPEGCEEANGGFIWRFTDTLAHRIVEPS